MSVTLSKHLTIKLLLTPLPGVSPVMRSGANQSMLTMVVILYELILPKICNNLLKSVK